MKRPLYRRFNKEVVANLVERFLEGDKFTFDEMVKKYLGIQHGTLAILMANRRAKGWVNTAKKHLHAQGEELACIDETEERKGVFGIVATKGHARYSMNRYYVLTKGVVQGAMNLQQVVRSKGLLKGRTTLETLSLPKVRG